MGHLLMIVSLFMLPTLAMADTAGHELSRFGILGTWSPDCAVDVGKVCDWEGADPFCSAERITYRAPIFGPASFTVVSNLRKISKVIMDISEAQIVASNKIKITYIIKNFVTKYGFEPKNGETWVDAIEMTHEKIRVLLRERADGGKILIKDGFRYVPVNDNNESFQKDVVPKIWKRTKISTNAFEKCFN